MKDINLFSFFCWEKSSFSRIICYQAIIFPKCFLCQKLNGRSFTILFPGPLFYSIVLLSIFMPISAVFITITLWYNLRSNIITPPASFFLLRVIVTIHGVWCLSMNSCIVFSKPVKCDMTILIGIALLLYINFGSIEYRLCSLLSRPRAPQK